MFMLHSRTLWLALASALQSMSVSFPERAFDMLTSASEQRSLCTIWISGISRENTAHTLPSTRAACSTMFMEKDVLPMPGRAAMTIKSDFCRPFVILSISLNPVFTPRRDSLSFWSAWNFSSTWSMDLDSVMLCIVEVSLWRDISYTRVSAYCTLRSASSDSLAVFSISMAARMSLRLVLSLFTISRYCFAFAVEGSMEVISVRYAMSPTFVRLPS